MKIRYEIIGKHRSFGMKDSWGKFDTFKEAVAYMETLKRSWGNIIQFKISEYMEATDMEVQE